MWKSILTHPCIIALEIGLLIMIFQIPVPSAISTFLGSLGRCSTPMIMLFLGMVMAEVGFDGLFTKDTWAFALLRLVHALFIRCIVTLRKYYWQRN